ncbi:hypothetical protein KAFR_0J02220 [Kazachstania africana CBS 2517]|uniref:Enoyl reductase (ER) domain-containing protein n=1 Tax=Kazachstania africana (strain ATCC 22294 / BCRC 22015 / CBS 2517 / CECT 1963 / NBRC 1671 / NRRL Y-8276) TaxID=1071382 RepID=H2B0Y6_KAZAF|nr:hypothetical protein KAFR_0J02220 [Kazachstania africana CBS 2517]CCF60286.1 hypothetical protein KAFR_0J02220 [Kazachstania africana CBS 2517]
MSVPKTMKAVFVEAGDEPVLKSNVPLPKVKDGHLLLKTKAAAGNPTDWKHVVHKMGGVNCVLGCDVAGEIVQLGPNVDEKKFRVGDNVYGFIHGASANCPENGAFAEYAVLDSKLAFRAPTDIRFSGKENIPPGPITTFEGAASIPCSWGTAGATLFHHFDLKYDWSEDKPQYDFPLLVWGGATALGQAIIQLAKRFNCYSKIITVASKKHEAQLKAYGADEVYDYHDGDIIEQIKNKYCNIKHLLDCVSSTETIQQVYQCSPDKEEAIVFNYMSMTESVIRPEIKKSNVKVDHTVIYLALGLDIVLFGSIIPANKKYRDDSVKFVEVINELFLNGEFKHVPVKVYKNGLASTLEMTDDIKNGRNSGEKLVAIFN